VKKQFDHVNDVTTVDTIDVLNTTLLRQLMLGTEDAIKPIDAVTNVFMEEPELLYNPKERHHSDRNIYSAGAIKLSTNIYNHLSLNLSNVIKRFIKLKNTTKSEYVELLYQVNGWKKKQQPEMITLSKEHHMVISESRRILGLLPDAQINKAWYKNKENIPYILRYFVYVNKCIENHNRSQNANGQTQLFNILPLCNIKSHFITIDTSVLYGIMKETKLVDCNSMTFTSLKFDHWCSLFKVGSLKGQHSIFTGTVETDGVAINFHFQREKNTNINKRP
jgi:hypothetical protein